jgi:hypothetical protein
MIIIAHTNMEPISGSTEILIIFQKPFCPLGVGVLNQSGAKSLE